MFTRRFDREVEAQSVARVLGGKGPTRADQEAAQAKLTDGLVAWRAEATLKAAEVSAKLRARLPPEALQDTVVSLLIDHSGSMRGQKALFAAAAANHAQEFLRGLGVKVEVLGFTTLRWRGGWSRRLWQLIGSPRNPGRLNDLLHIVYRSAADLRVSEMPYSFQAMLYPGLLKENLDGEALLWAAGRLDARPETRRILVILSDGAPVDDATLAANYPHFLENHLLNVVADLAEGGTVEVSAIGVGFDVSRYYPRSRMVEAPERLGVELIEFLAERLTA